jgi:hypothetical protein
MLREGGRLTLSDFAKVAAHSGLLKARVESKWHRGGLAAPNNSMRRRERFALHGPNGSLCGRKAGRVCRTRIGDETGLIQRHEVGLVRPERVPEILLSKKEA